MVYPSASCGMQLFISPAVTSCSQSCTDAGLKDSRLSVAPADFHSALHEFLYRCDPGLSVSLRVKRFFIIREQLSHSFCVGSAELCREIHFADSPPDAIADILVRKCIAVWNVGVMVRVPIWNWGDVAYKVRAAKGATAIATLQKNEVREMIELQVNQSSFKVNEATKKLEMAKASTARADENLRMANLGFGEGVISSTTVMEAQTAWLQAQSQKIDAEIDVKLSQVNLQKALGVLR